MIFNSTFIVEFLFYLKYNKYKGREFMETHEIILLSLLGAFVLLVVIILIYRFIVKQ